MAPTPSTMRAAAIDRFGGELALHTLPVPEVGRDEVLIHLEAAGVGVWDPFECEGGFHRLGMAEGEPSFPYVPGSDGAGTIVAVGTDVRRFREGERVYAFSLLNPKGGCYAEYVAVPAERVSRVPDAMSVEEAGALPVDGITALRGLGDALGLQPGESLLVFGAGGGVGHLAVQLAKRMGVRVLAVASGADGVALARKLGADVAVDGREEDVVAAARRFAPGGIDAALVTAGGPECDEALTVLRDGGRVAYPNGVEPEPNVRAGIERKAYDGTPDREAIDALDRLIDAGSFTVHVARAFPLERAAEAHRVLDEHYLGKLVLRPPASS